jgi:hypothetical protein
MENVFLFRYNWNEANDVAIDYTAAIMTAVAGLKHDTQSSRGFRVLGQWRG